MKFILFDKARGGFWFRIYGYGLNFINRDISPPPFSVRNGFKKEIRIGKFAVSVLKRSKLVR